MLEESVESFVMRFKTYAATVEVLARPEGSPLLECVVGETVLQVLERTNPYAAQPGTVQLILNPTTDKLEHADKTQKSVATAGLGRLRATGRVLEREPQAVIVDAGVPLVVTLFEVPADTAPGDWVSFESLAPVHGFFVPPTKRGLQRRETDGESL